MPALNWETFKECSGDVRINFENLCRGIVRAHFGGYGHFKALKNQPGVEYHINLSQDCPSLGDATKWFGWQCKWFELNQDKSLKAASKKDIVDSLNKTVTHVPNLTDWVLWTPFTLAKKDQTWFDGLEKNYPFKLHLWAEEELDNWLAGPAETLRKTYFGELILSSETLKEQHERSIAPIKDRWLTPVHQITKAEIGVRRALATPAAYKELESIRQSLSQCRTNILKFESTLASEEELLKDFINASDEYLDILNNLEAMLLEGDIESLHEWLASPALKISEDTKRFVRVLRKLKLPIALDAANALDDMFLAKRLFNSLDEKLKVTLIAVLADAGGGKTQLSAQISTANPSGAYGIYIQGKFLSKTSTLDSLANRYKINGASVGTFEELIFALNVAGQRAKCRLPIVIDGLNEAEDPRVWKDELASILPVLENARNVLLVCTLRTGEMPRRGYYERRHVDQRESFAVQALPDGITKIEMDGFGEFTAKAIRDYLNYYRIDAGDTELPLSFFKRPITLRIYCEVTNPDKSEVVKINQFPTSLPEIFGRYIDYSCKKISEMTHLPQQYSEDDIRLALYFLGQCWWESNSRDCDEKAFKKLIQDDVVWDASLVNLLSQEGIIFRNPGERPGQFELTPVYDALGGFLIADFLIQSNSRDNQLSWFSTVENLEKFGGDESHYLSSDIFRSLTSLVPKRFHGVQLWTLVPQEYKVSALLGVSEIQPSLIDQESADKIEYCFQQDLELRGEIFNRLSKVRSNKDNPLNSKFLTRLLKDLPVSERDLCWTEWVRHNSEKLVSNVRRLDRKWAAPKTKVSESDILIAEWLMWSLTTTNRQFRDDITNSLYQFGLKTPEYLFQLTLESSSINDPYVFERMLAASYAVILNAKFLNQPIDATEFAEQIKSSFYSVDSEIYTSHFMICKYIQNILKLSGIVFTEEQTEIKRSLESLYSGSRGKVDWEERIKHPFRMDFENYTIGRLIPSRGNYDYGHAGYIKVKEQMLWRVRELGWGGNFDQIDSRISSIQHYPRMGKHEGKIDRYGKKYAWIAYDEMAGVLISQGELEGDWDCPSAELDLSFIPIKETEDLVGIEALELNVKSDNEWLNLQSAPTNVKDYINAKEQSSDFVLLDGTFDKQDPLYTRSVFVRMRGYFVANTKVDEILEHFDKCDFSSHNLPEKASSYNVSYKEFVTSHQDTSLTESNFDFKIGTEQKEIESPKINFDNGNFEIDPEKVEKQIIDVPKYHSIPCDCTTVSVSKSINDESEGSVRTLSPRLIKEFELCGQSQCFDLIDKDGMLATLIKGNQKNTYKNYEEFLYLRKDLLDEYLRKNDLALIYVNWGERQIKSDDRNIQYNVFHDVALYMPEAVK